MPEYFGKGAMAESDEATNMNVAMPDRDTHDSAAGIEVDDSQYHEVSQSFSVLAKDGEEAVAETQFDDDRPRTAGSARSGNTDLNEEDSSVLERLQTSNVSNDSLQQTFTPPASGTLFTRLDAEEATAAPSGFSYAVATSKQLDFKGTRKGPVANVGAPVDTVAVNDGAPTAAAAEDGLEQTQHEQHAPAYDAVQAEHANQTARVEGVQFEGKPKKRKKKKKVQRYKTAPTEHLDHDFLAAQPVMMNIDHAPEVAHPDGTDEMQLGPVDASEPALDSHAPENPGPVEADQGGYEAPPSSPNDQLRDDLEAATSPKHREIAENGREFEQPTIEEDPQDEARSMISPHANAAAITQNSTGNFTVKSYARPEPNSRTPISSRRDTGRVTKPKSRMSRRSTAPLPIETLHSDQSTSSDINDLLQNAAHKMEQKKQSTSARHAAERDGLIAELQQVVDAKQALQDDLDALQQQKATLAADLKKQQGKVTVYEVKLSRFRTFVDGLGNDVDCLRKDAGATRRKGEQLAQDNDDRKAEQAALFEQLAACSEKYAQLKDRALKACQDAQSDLQAAQYRNDYLEQQLSERSGLLAEERDRRSQLERQLITAASSEEKVARVLKSSNESMLDKLYEIHAALDTSSKEGKKDAEMAEKILAAIQALTTQDSSNANELLSVKGMVEGLSESITSFLETAGEQSPDDSIFARLQTALYEAFKTLRADLSQREQQIEQEAVRSEQLDGLQNKLKNSDDRCNDLQRQLFEVSERETELKNRTESLQARVDALHSNASSDTSANAQLNDIKRDLEYKATALQRVSKDLGGKRQEVETLRTSNSRLQEEMKVERCKSGELRAEADAAKAQAAELQGQYEAKFKTAIKEQKAHSEEYVATERMKIENQVHGLVADCKAAQEKIQALENEKKSVHAKLQELQKTGAALQEGKESEVTQLKEQIEAYQQKVADSEAQIANLETSMKGNRSYEQQYKAVKGQLEAAEKSNSKVMSEKSALATQLKGLEKALQSAQTAEQQARTDLAAHQEEQHTALSDLEQRLTQAEAARARAEEGVEKVKLQCNEAIEVEKAKGDKHLEALQQRLGEAETELENQKFDAEEFRTKVDEAWRHEEARHKEASEAMGEEIKKAEKKKTEAATECEHLRKTVEELIKRAAKGSKSFHQQPQMVTSDSVSQVPGGHTVYDGVTPTASNKENEPPRPRKKVDRNAGGTIEADPIPAPEALRPDSCARSAGGQTRGPVVEESQLHDGIQEVLAPRNIAGNFPLSMLSDNSEEMLDTASMARSQHPPEVVEDTQFDDKLPSFAAFNTSMNSSQPHRRNGTSSVFSVPSIRALSQSSKAVPVGKGGKPPHSLPNPAGFAIFEDDQGSQHSKSLIEISSTSHQARESLAKMDADDNYTYRKPMPQPNSASKMVRPKQTEHSVHRRNSRNKRTPAPQVRGEGRSSAGSHGPQTMRAVMQSSSPDFINDASYSGRKTNIYRTPGGGSGAKRRASRTNSNPTVDPRLLKREPAIAPSPAPKRKSGGQIVEGYEHERKKRKHAESAATSDSSRYAVRGAAQPSIRDVPNMSSLSRGAVEPRSRMQTFGGAGARVGRGRKATKADDFDARFTQELRRR